MSFALQAKVFGMEKSLHMTGNQYSLAAAFVLFPCLPSPCSR